MGEEQWLIELKHCFHSYALFPSRRFRVPLPHLSPPNPEGIWGRWHEVTEGGFFHNSPLNAPPCGHSKDAINIRVLHQFYFSAIPPTFIISKTTNHDPPHINLVIPNHRPDRFHLLVEMVDHCLI